MAAQPELISHHLCPYLQPAVITLAEKNVAHRRTYVDLADKPEWFRRISPLGRVPLLRIGEHVRFDSAVICEYLDETTPGSLHPLDALERAVHRAWIEHASTLLDDIAAFYVAPDAGALDSRRALIIARLVSLERHLGAGPWFAGARFSLVDASCGPVFRHFDVFERVRDFGFFTGSPRIEAWREALRARASVRDAVAPDYTPRLLEFLTRKRAHLSSLITQAVAA